jgi:hypothetical protein
MVFLGLITFALWCGSAWFVVRFNIVCGAHQIELGYAGSWVLYIFCVFCICCPTRFLCFFVNGFGWGFGDGCS